MRKLRDYKKRSGGVKELQQINSFWQSCVRNRTIRWAEGSIYCSVKPHQKQSQWKDGSIVKEGHRQKDWRLSHRNWTENQLHIFISMCKHIIGVEFRTVPSEVDPLCKCLIGSGFIFHYEQTANAASQDVSHGLASPDLNITETS